MTINDLLSKKKENVIEKSFNLTISTYPEDSQAFFKEKKKQFTNPVGYTIYQGIEKIVDKLINDESLDSFIPPLEEIIQIRAVQDFTPSQAVGFIFLLKKAIYEELRKEAEPEKLLDFLAQIDSLALVAFDIFMKYREKIYDLKAKELIDRTWWILKKWNIVSEIENETVEKTKN
ncbi:RsbT co-antagonist protein rsbRD N-terminal domain-containing protein [Thermodesulfovibrio aggregans]|uniref:RsbT co-antagonist protein rsbRD N-terminal domain-containing protein n=1 Tax=Thermodesulfovibrio aggregans TaxID=86166 RepID=A0A0U9HMI1_9BACT|nr:RsbRD N-terminal domain-containing protein [Thermodesulfovibrio aggregans]GAQ94296.1 RsbT co-antagonist protein rsbRD N-terminal domain-containing protein [Thermodesulfovibrio aggregans]